MGKRGPQPTPTAILKMRGSWRAKDRETRGEPVPPAGPVVCPDWLVGTARKVWEEFAPWCIDVGVLTPNDIDAFADWCRMRAILRCSEMMDPIEFSKLASASVKLGQRFGLDPSGRASMHAPPKPQADDKVKKFFGGA